MRKRKLEQRIDELRGKRNEYIQNLEAEIDGLRKHLGYGYDLGNLYFKPRPFVPPEVSLAKKMDVLCDYLGIDIVRVESKEKIKCVKRQNKRNKGKGGER